MESLTAKKYEELRHEFLDAWANSDEERFHLLLRHPAPNYAYLIKVGFEPVIYVPWCDEPYEKSVILAYRETENDGPLATLKRLSAKGWAMLPAEFSRPLSFMAIDHNYSPGWSAYQYWIWTLYCALAFNGHEKSDRLELGVFQLSADLIEQWRLNTHSPIVPDWLLDDKQGNAEATGDKSLRLTDADETPERPSEKQAEAAKPTSAAESSAEMNKFQPSEDQPDLVKGLKTAESGRDCLNSQNDAISEPEGDQDGYVSKADLDAVVGRFVEFKTIQNKFKPKADRTGSNNRSMYLYSEIRKRYLEHDKTLGQVLPETCSDFFLALQSVQSGQ